MTSNVLIDEEGLRAAVKWSMAAKERGDEFLKEFGIRQIVEAYESGKKLHLARTTLSTAGAEDVLYDHIVILKNHCVHVSKTVRSLYAAGFSIVTSTEGSNNG